jgi:hypothetical protein
MDRTLVKSSDITSIGYDSNQNLEVEFHTGNIYQYQGVPRTIYNNLMSAKSHGSYFCRYIKNANYKFRKIK